MLLIVPLEKCNGNDRCGGCYGRYYLLSEKAGTAYVFYSFTNNLLPNLVTALVLFYGGRLVMEGDITGGKVTSLTLTHLGDV